MSASSARRALGQGGRKEGGRAHTRDMEKTGGVAVTYFPLRVFYPHDGTAEKEGVLGVKLGDGPDAWVERECAVRGNNLFIFNDEASVGDSGLDGGQGSLQETASNKKRPAVKKDGSSNAAKQTSRKAEATTIIPLEFAVVQHGHESAGTRFSFVVYHADARTGSYHFSQFLATTTDLERSEWMDVISSCCTRDLLQEREDSAVSATQATEELENVHVQLAAEQEQRKRIAEMLDAQADLGRALTVRAYIRAKLLHFQLCVHSGTARQ